LDRRNRSEIGWPAGNASSASRSVRRSVADARITGIDVSDTGLRHTRELQRKYKLDNLELHQLPIERVREIGRSFDLAVCTGVLHHLPDPNAGLQALRDVLRPSGAMRLMVYARYGRAGIYMVQEYCRLLEIGASGSRSAYLAACDVPQPATRISWFACGRLAGHTR